MARIKNSEDFVKKSILMFAKTVRNEEEYDKFLQNANGVFNTYPLTEDDKEEQKGNANIKGVWFEAEYIRNYPYKTSQFLDYYIH